MSRTPTTLAAADNRDAFGELQRHLAGVVCRLRWSWSARWLAGLWLIAALLTAIGAFVERPVGPGGDPHAAPGAADAVWNSWSVDLPAPLATAAALSVGLLTWVRAANRRTRQRPLLPANPKPARGLLQSLGRLCGPGDAALRDRAVRRLEAVFPDLDGRLSTACEQRPESPGDRFHVLQWLLLEQVCGHARTHDWNAACRPGGTVAGAVTVAGVAVGLAMAIACQRGLARSEPPAQWTLSIAASRPTHPPRLQATVEPGDAEVEFGSNVVVTASFPVPPQTRVWLVVGEGAGAQRRAMQRLLDGTTFTAQLTASTPQQVYRVATEEWTSRDYRLTAFRRPELERMDATIVFPSYADRPPAVLSDVTRVSVPDRGRLELTAWASVPAAVVALVPERAGEPQSVGELGRIPGVVLFEPVPHEKLREAPYEAPSTAETATSAGGGASAASASPPDGAAAGIPYRVAWQPQRSEVYRVFLFDARGHRNRRPPRFSVALVPNRRPRLRVPFPGRDRQVSPLEELTVEAEAHDDFGLIDFGLVYQVPGHPPRRVSLLRQAATAAQPPLSAEGRAAAPSPPGTRPLPFASARYVIALEELQVRPDQLVCYHAYAVDRDTFGHLRETFSDMFFAEVRPFEEIYRQGQSPASGSQKGPSGNARQAEQLAQQQKEVINATWALWRHLPAVATAVEAAAGEGTSAPAATGAEDADPSASNRSTAAMQLRSFAADVDVVREAQGAVRIRLRQLLQKLNDPQAIAYARQADDHIETALQALARGRAAASDRAGQALADALQAEQLAYQALLKLRAREHQVVQGQNGGGQGQSSGRSAEQLKQLELTNRENRYEAERRATQPSARQRERLQALSRLRELARRQQEIQDRLRELQAQLLAQDTDDAPPETVQRELRRLRDAQRSVLQDLDELQQRLQQHDDPATRTARQQLQRTREHVRRSAEELRRGQVGRAIAEASRAQQQLSRVHDDIRRTAASQFAEDIRRLSQQSGELAQRQEQIANRMNDPDRKRPGLRPSGDRRELAAALRQQREDLRRLLDAMADLTQRAESSEPLLARRLYESARQAHGDRLEETLQAAAEALANRQTEAARDLERRARNALQRLRAGLQDAERAVLGDELTALKLARSQLDDLVDAVRREWKPDGRPDGAGTGNRPASRPTRRSLARNDGRTQSTKARGETEAPVRGLRARQAASDTASPPRREKAGASNASPDAARRKPSGRSEQDGADANRPSRSGTDAPRREAAAGSPPQDRSAASASNREGKGSSGRSPTPSPADPGADRRAASSGRSPNADGNGRRSERSAASGLPRTARRLNANGESSRDSGGPGGPILGSGFREWSDRMRELEETVSVPELRDRLIAAREAARQLRLDWKRHGKEPNWDLVRARVWEPLLEVARELDEEIARRDLDRRHTVPLEREPVPEPFSEVVRRYFEELGRGR